MGSRKRQRANSFAEVSPQPQPQSEGLTFDKVSASSPGWLPHDLIKHCLTFVKHNELVGARRVNHAWLAAVADCVECLLSLRYSKELVQVKWYPSYKWLVSKLALCSLNYMTESFRERITEIQLHSYPRVQLASGHIHACSSLQKLDVWRPQGCETVRIQGLELIPALQEVTIAGPAAAVDVTCLSSCRSLKKLALFSCDFTETGIQGLETMPALEWLNLDGSRLVDGVGYLAHCRALRVLSLRGCPNLKDANIAGLERIPTLEELNLSETNLTDVTALSQCNKLKKLYMFLCDHLTDAGIQGLERIPTLEELDLSYSAITSVSHLAACQSLKRLVLAHCSHLSDPGIQGLELVPTLEEVDLIRCTGITCVSHLRGCKALKRLELYGCEQLAEEC